MLKENISKIYLLFMFILNAALASMLLLYPKSMLRAGVLLLLAMAALNILSVLVGFFVNKNKFNSFAYTLLYLIVIVLFLFFIFDRVKLLRSLYPSEK